jgi:predicted amidohydrolase YtcJ
MKKILHNAHIHTQNKAAPYASAMVIENAKIIAIGETDKILAEFGNCPKWNMDGRIILPGITDAHIHLQHYGMGLHYVDCGTSSMEECLLRLKERLSDTPPGKWILGHGWNQNDWEEGFGSSKTLDDISPNNPVYLTAKSLHAAWVNTMALDLTGIDSSTKDPKNGRIIRDAGGNPTGILLEGAMEMTSALIPEPDIENLAKTLQIAQTELWKLGITGVHDFDRQTCYSAIKLLNDREKLKLRVLKSIPVEDFHNAIEMQLKSGFGEGFLRIGSLKLFADGALGPHTAAMLEPFVDETENYGILNMDQKEILEIGTRAVSNGISLAVHAIGDRANREVLDAFTDLRIYERSKGYSPLRHRIEHVQLLNPLDTRRLANLSLTASMQPIHATSDMFMAERSWGIRSADAYAWRSQLQQGTRLAFGSDAPVESPNPFLGLHAAVTRQRVDGAPGQDGWHPEQVLTFEEALIAFTQGPAFLAGLEKELGRLEENFLADLIVLDQDPFVCHPSEIADILPTATMVAGEWVWEQ